ELRPRLRHAHRAAPARGAGALRRGAGRASQARPVRARGDRAPELRRRPRGRPPLVVLVARAGAGLWRAARAALPRPVYARMAGSARISPTVAARATRRRVQPPIRDAR